jgi:hypothetical protein
MSFFSKSPCLLPEGAKYFFNILVINIGINYDNLSEFFNNGSCSAWYLDAINNPRPYVIHFFASSTPYDWELIGYPHCVIEITPEQKISFYEMLDFGTSDPWRID